MKNKKNDVTPDWDTIKTYFTQKDIDCMNARGTVDLSSCKDVREQGALIYLKVKSGDMPYGGPPWSKVWVDNFKAWLDDTTAVCPPGP